MNIFVTDKNPAEAARALDDKRLIKMVLESTQLLCTALNHKAGKQVTPYKSTHVNHPCSVWTRDNFENWTWLFAHALNLCVEYSNRFNKKHKCYDILMQLTPHTKHLNKGTQTPFANCAAHKGMNISYKHINPVTMAYKEYLIHRWNTDKRHPKWTNSIGPSWMIYNQTKQQFELNKSYEVLYGEV